MIVMLGKWPMLGGRTRKSSGRELLHCNVPVLLVIRKGCVIALLWGSQWRPASGHCQISSAPVYRKAQRRLSVSLVLRLPLRGMKGLGTLTIFCKNWTSVVKRAGWSV